MAKAKTTAFFCKECGYESAKWMGQCPACKEWNTFVEEPIVKKESSSSGKIRLTERRKPVALSEISIEEKDRVSTGYQELDRVLGGGVVGGSLVLVEAIRVLVNPHFFCRFVGIWRQMGRRYCIFLVKNP